MRCRQLQREGDCSLEKAYTQALQTPCYQTWTGIKITVIRGPNLGQPGPVPAPA